MIKVFTLNKNKKIELTEKELKELLDAAYWEGRNDVNKTYVYTTPYHNWWEGPYYTTTTTASTSILNDCVSKDQVVFSNEPGYTNATNSK